MAPADFLNADRANHIAHAFRWRVGKLKLARLGRDFKLVGGELVFLGWNEKAALEFQGCQVVESDIFCAGLEVQGQSVLSVAPASQNEAAELDIQFLNRPRSRERPNSCTDAAACLVHISKKILLDIDNGVENGDLIELIMEDAIEIEAQKYAAEFQYRRVGIKGGWDMEIGDFDHLFRAPQCFCNLGWGEVDE